MSVPKIVKVWWVDACSTSHAGGLTKKGAIESNLQDVENIGYLVYEDKTKTIIANHVILDNEEEEMYFRDYIVIPTNCIRETVVL